MIYGDGWEVAIDRYMICSAYQQWPTWSCHLSQKFTQVATGSIPTPIPMPMPIPIPLLVPYTVYRIPYTVYRIPYTVYRIPYTVYRILYTVYRIPYTVYLNLYQYLYIYLYLCLPEAARTANAVVAVLSGCESREEPSKLCCHGLWRGR